MSPASTLNRQPEAPNRHPETGRRLWMTLPTSRHHGGRCTTRNRHQKVDPRAALQRHSSGAWPIDRRERNRPTVPSVPHTADTLPPPPCPICGSPAQREAFHAAGDIRFIDYICPASHLWQTKWLVGGAA